MKAAGSSGAQRWLPTASLAALYAVAVAFYVLLARGQPVPQVTPDEFTYGALARAVAAGDGLELRGEPFELPSALYIFAIAPAWLATSSTVDAYAIAKIIGAVLCCLVVVPTWLLARQFVRPLAAFVAASLAVTGSWMTQTGQLITENLALPLAAGCLAALTVALTRPQLARVGWLALALALLAAWARAQLAVLIPIILVVLLVDTALAEARRERLRRNAPLLALTGLITIAGGIAVIADPSLLGAYSDLQDEADLSRGVPLSGEQGLAYIAMAGVLPFVIALAASLRRASWNADQLRPLLIVFWTSTIVLVVQTGILTTAFAGAEWSIQRYVEYSLPVLYVLVVAAVTRGLIGIRSVVWASIAVAGALLLTPQLENPQEQRGFLGLSRAGDALLGASLGQTLALTTVLLGGCLACALAAERRGSAPAIVLVSVVLGTGAIFMVQGQQGWSWQREQATAWRAGFPENLQWIDGRTRGADVARLIGASNPFRAATTEFFNRDVTRIYAPEQGYVGRQLVGATCSWGVDDDGFPVFSEACGPPPTRFLLDDDYAKLTFAGQRVLGSHEGVGRLVEVTSRPPTRPRLEASITPACSAVIPTQDLHTGESRGAETGCYPQSSGQLWLREAGRITMGFRGGLTDYTVQIVTSEGDNPRTFDLPAGTTRRVSIPVPAGKSEFQIDFGFDRPVTLPQQLQTSIELIQGDRRDELLY